MCKTNNIQLPQIPNSTSILSPYIADIILWNESFNIATQGKQYAGIQYL